VLSDIAQRIKVLTSRLVNMINSYLANRVLLLKRFDLAKATIAKLLSLREQRFSAAKNTLSQALLRLAMVKGERYNLLAARLSPMLIAKGFDRKENQLNNLYLRLNFVWQKLLSEKNNKFQILASLLASYDYHATLKRGFALVKDENNQLVKAAKSIKLGQSYRVEFYEGTAIMQKEAALNE
jgi:exodeoxyribonuclease VII large subunit